jgi:hypothetical protein
MTAELFEVGDRVTMNEYGMEVYGPSKSNPHHEEGEIIEKGYNYRVRWDNGASNSYDDKHLVLVERQTAFKTFMRSLDERDTLPKVQRVRSRGKSSLKKSTTGPASAGLGSAMGLSSGHSGHFNFESQQWVSSPQPYYTLEEDVEQEDIPELDPIDWDSDSDEHDEIPQSSETF